jgi:hypothetical protein
MQAIEKSGALKTREWRRRYVPWLVALLAIAAGLRFGPIAAGLPYIDYVDEGYALHQAIHLLNNRTLDTSWYGYPSLPAYLSAAALCAWKPVYRNVHGRHFRNDLPRQDIVETTSGYNYDLISPPELIVAGRSCRCLPKPRHGSIGRDHCDAGSRARCRLSGHAPHRALPRPCLARVEPDRRHLRHFLCPACRLFLRGFNLTRGRASRTPPRRVSRLDWHSLPNIRRAPFLTLSLSSSSELPTTTKLRLRLGLIGAGGLLVGSRWALPQRSSTGEQFCETWRSRRGTIRSSRPHQATSARRSAQPSWAGHWRSPAASASSSCCVVDRLEGWLLVGCYLPRSYSRRS